MSEEDPRLVAARERIEAARARGEHRRALVAVDRAVAEAEREADVAEATAAAEDQGLELGRTLERVEVLHADGTVALVALVKTPPPAVFRSFRTAMEGRNGEPPKGAKREEVYQGLWRACLVYPTADAFSAACDRLPRAADMVCDAIVTLAGAREEEIKKK